MHPLTSWVDAFLSQPWQNRWHFGMIGTKKVRVADHRGLPPYECAKYEMLLLNFLPAAG